MKINGIKDLSNKELDEFGGKLGLAQPNKSRELIKIDLINLSKIVLGGQVIYFLEMYGLNFIITGKLSQVHL